MVKFAKILRTHFFTEHQLLVTAYALPVVWLLLIKQLFCYLVTYNIGTNSNNFVFTTQCLMYKKSNSFVYKFVVNSLRGQRVYQRVYLPPPPSPPPVWFFSGIAQYNEFQDYMKKKIKPANRQSNLQTINNRKIELLRFKLTSDIQ